MSPIRSAKIWMAGKLERYHLCEQFCTKKAEEEYAVGQSAHPPSRVPHGHSRSSLMKLFEMLVICYHGFCVFIQGRENKQQQQHPHTYVDPKFLFPGNTNEHE